MTERSRLTIRDAAAEALAGLLRRPGRSAMTALGTLLGVGAFVAVLGLTATAGGQIDKRFTALAATEVTVTDVGAAASGDTGLSFPDDASGRVEALNGVVHAGVHWTVPLRDPVLSGSPLAPAAAGLSLVAAAPQALAAMHPVMRSGRLFDGFHDGRGEQVAVLGAEAAARLGVVRLDANPAVFVDGRPYAVIGVIDELQRRPELRRAVILPPTTALRVYGPPVRQRAEMIIETAPGAARVVAAQVPVALRPDAPSRFAVPPPAEPRSPRAGVTTDVDALFLLLAVISLVVGALGIANATLTSVTERSAEIGLRRSLGARPRHIAAQFLIESTTLGLLGGLVGGGLGVPVVVLAAVANEWTAVLAPWTVLTAPGLGALAGLLAGAYPAVRAAAIEPVEALRG